MISLAFGDLLLALMQNRGLIPPDFFLSHHTSNQNNRSQGSFWFTWLTLTQDPGNCIWRSLEADCMLLLRQNCSLASIVFQRKARLTFKKNSRGCYRFSFLDHSTSVVGASPLVTMGFTLADVLSGRTSGMVPRALKWNQETSATVIVTLGKFLNLFGPQLPHLLN